MITILTHVLTCIVAADIKSTLSMKSKTNANNIGFKAQLGQKKRLW